VEVPGQYNTSSQITHLNTIHFTHETPLNSLVVLIEVKILRGIATEV
jgi:hypothetical protein